MAGEPGRYPPQVKFIAGTEALERVAFQGVRSILVMAMTGLLAYPDAQAKAWYHGFLMLAALTPLLGAWLADRVLGRYRTILAASLLGLAGLAALALWQSPAGLALGLAPGGLRQRAPRAPASPPSPTTSSAPARTRRSPPPRPGPTGSSPWAPPPPCWPRPGCCATAGRCSPSPCPASPWPPARSSSWPGRRASSAGAGRPGRPPRLPAGGLARPEAPGDPPGRRALARAGARPPPARGGGGGQGGGPAGRRLRRRHRLLGPLRPDRLHLDPAGAAARGAPRPRLARPRDRRARAGPAPGARPRAGAAPRAAPRRRAPPGAAAARRWPSPPAGSWRPACSSPPPPSPRRGCSSSRSTPATASTCSGSSRSTSSSRPARCWWR